MINIDCFMIQIVKSTDVRTVLYCTELYCTVLYCAVKFEFECKTVYELPRHPDCQMRFNSNIQFDLIQSCLI